MQSMQLDATGIQAALAFHVRPHSRHFITRALTGFFSRQPGGVANVS
jgi:hypothetical protein